MRIAAALLVAISIAVAACGEESESRAAKQTAVSCPPAWKPGWQRLANRIDAPVYCPTWMPNPLDGEIGGTWSDIESVDRDRSYLMSFLWHESGPGGGDVHVNFRGYPGRTAIPKCDNADTRPRRQVPCFSDPRGVRRLGRLRVRMYTVNQDADQWHVVYLWRRAGSLYTASLHVAPPLTYRKVLRNLDRITRSLVVVRPAA